MLPEVEQNTAKLLAMNASSFVGELAERLVSPGQAPPDLSGWLTHAMPGIFERALLTSPHLKSDQAVSLYREFFSAFSEITRITCNAGGFSNPIKKFMFNVAFGRMFDREATHLSGVLRALWDEARKERGDPLEYLSAALIAAAEAKTGSRLSTDRRANDIKAVLAERFSTVHEICR